MELNCLIAVRIYVTWRDYGGAELLNRRHNSVFNSTEQYTRLPEAQLNLPLSLVLSVMQC